MSGSSNVPALDPERYKATTREQWDSAKQAWHNWAPTLQQWLGPATEIMLDMAGVKPGRNESYGQIYPNLKKLANEGLVSCKTQRQKGRPNRHIYSVTEKGRERLKKWLAVPSQPEIPRNELLLKLFLASRVLLQS